jgi:predicted nucleotidyltransferase
VVQAEAERAIVSAVRSAVGTRPVVLIGSRATGEATARSDYDAYVVLPAHRIPFLLPRLDRASRDLEARLDVRVALNALPRFRLRRPGRSLVVWKLAREGRVLVAPEGLGLRIGASPAPSAEARCSYATAGLRYLISRLDPPALRGPEMPAELRNGVRKALLHAAQLRLLRSGTYAPTTSEAAEQVRALGAEDLATLLVEHELVDAWFLARDLLIAELRTPARRFHERFALNLQYVVLRRLRGRAGSLRALDAREAVCDRLRDATVALASAVLPGGRLDAAAVTEAQLALPAVLRPWKADWANLRDVVEEHSPDAHPLVGI